MCSTLRIQRKRVRGWRMPEGAIYVGRGSRFGNPYKIGEQGISTRLEAKHAFQALYESKDWQKCGLPSPVEIKQHLKGKILACWCPEHEPCHADVLMNIANAVQKSK